MKSEKIMTLTNAASIDLEPIWAMLLAKALQGKNIKDLLSDVGPGGVAPTALSMVPSATVPPPPPPPAVAPEALKEMGEKEEESDEDMVRLCCICFMMRSTQNGSRFLVCLTEVGP